MKRLNIRDVNWWHGINAATVEHHDAVYKKYGHGDLAAYHFRVSDNLDAAEVDSSPGAANGIWTLAEIFATGASWTLVASVAARMKGAIRRFTQCEHDWHYYGTVNGKPDYGCQKCGASK